MSARVRRFVTPRVLTPVVLWLLSLWLLHRYLFALPVPGWRTTIRPGYTPPSSTIPRLESEFPTPPQRVGEDQLDSVDPTHRPFHPLPPAEDPFPVLRPTRFLPKECLESWFIYGELACRPEELGEEDMLDATWLWVNGTDSRWAKDLDIWTKRLNVHSPAKHFREQNELMYSIRSVVKSLKGHLRTVHLIVSDTPFNPATDVDLLRQSTKDKLERQFGNGPRTEQGISEGLHRHLENNWRVAQTPQWLNFSAMSKTNRAQRQGYENDQIIDKDDYPEFRYASHSEIFQLPTYGYDKDDEESLGEREWKMKDWKQRSVPTFNSMAIEGRLGWVPGLADVSVALNDDFFMLRDLSVSDFHSPLFGSVIRFDPNYYQQVRPVMEEWRQTESGEAGGLYHANWLLSHRYPKRLRPYFAHAPKVVTRNLHHEATLMFQEATEISATRRFREAKIGASDIQIQWLLTSLRVERWREGLLWTWAVANIGARTGNWDETAREAIKDLFGLTSRDDDVSQIEVHRGERWTMRRERIHEMFQHAGWGAPKSTNYLFSSMDGHLPNILTPGKDESNDVCVLDLEQCFGSFWSEGATTSAADMFKRLTFEKPECGDCMIMALVTASGPLGLSAVFPPADAVFTNSDSQEPPAYLEPPHLPLHSTWQEVDFSLENVMTTTAMPGEEVKLREYCMYLLSRYMYVSGKSIVHFHMLRAPDQAKQVFETLDNNRAVTILGMNDDIETGYDRVRKMMGDWFESRWSEPAVWEHQP